MSLTLRSALLAGALALSGRPAFAEPITLEQAISKAADVAPLLRADEAAIAAARAGRVQASVRPNPSITLESENFVGQVPTTCSARPRSPPPTASNLSGVESGQARIGLADSEIGVAEASARVSRLDLAAAVERAFIDVLIARQVVDIAAYRLTEEQGIEREALRRVRAYKDPLFVETRVGGRVAQARISTLTRPGPTQDQHNRALQM